MNGTVRQRVKIGGILFCIVLLASISATAQEIRKPKASLKEHTAGYPEKPEIKIWIMGNPPATRRSS